MSRFWVSPGVAYLTRGFLSVFFPTASSVIIIQRLASLQGFRVPHGFCPWWFWAQPLWGLLLIFSLMSQRRKATRLGARLVPRVQGKWPGNLDKVVDIFMRLENEYLGIISTMLVTDHQNYVKGVKFGKTVDSVLGTGVFNSDGNLQHAYRLHRTMTRPFFNHDRISHFEIFDRHVNRTIALAKERFKMDLAIDFQDLISRFTLDSASEFLFGHCTDSLSAELPFPRNTGESTDTIQRDIIAAFSDAFSQAQHAISRRLILGSTWPMTEILADSTAQDMKVVSEFLDPIFEAALRRHSTAAKSDENNTAGNETLVDHLVKLTSDFKVIKDETLNILLAGRDSITSALTSAIYLLAMHPEVLSRLREEIISKFGLSGVPTHGDIKEMKYMQAFLNGAYSHFLSDVEAPLTYFRNNTPLPSPVRSPISVFLMHRRTDLWGPDDKELELPLEFDPDRWLDERLQKYLLADPSIFLPFNAGPRNCLGQKLAYNQMSFVLIRLLQIFSAIALSPEPSMCPPAWWAEKDGRAAIERFKPKNHVLLYAEGGMWVKMLAVDDVEVIQ
ncbi:cytochrome P450 [Suillus bovinus]|uniref:cytochrome P450 n=1 Tax=Suillus bovinus TaxID=48563 RepID=UPI001B8643EB|nr:cytochrome P450 [Suillus bovinus]KAG2158407.1 cytochrome P450 [Suillus bovinus]